MGRPERVASRASHCGDIALEGVKTAGDRRMRETGPGPCVRQGPANITSEEIAPSRDDDSQTCSQGVHTTTGE